MTANTKKTLGLVALFIILSAAIGGLNFFKEKSANKENFSSRIDKSQFSKIEIWENEKTAILEKSGGNWQIDGKTADKEMVDVFLGQIGKINSAELISTNQQKQVSFGLTDQSLKIKVYQGSDVALDFSVGRYSPEQFGQFISLAGDENTYFANIFIMAGLGQSLRDKKIDKVRAADIIGLSWQYAKEKFSLRKENSEWKLDFGPSANGDNVEQFLSELINLSAVDFADDKSTKETGIDAPQLKLEIILADKKIDLNLGKVTDDVAYLKASDEASVYIINNSASDLLKKQAKDFK